MISKSKVSAIMLLCCLSVIGSGFSAWTITRPEEDYTFSGNIYAGDNEIVDSEIINLNSVHKLSKSDIVAKGDISDTDTYGSLKLNTTWTNNGSSAIYIDPNLTTYFDMYDNNYPFSERSPHLFDYNTKETLWIDRHSVSGSTLTSEIVYSNVYDILDATVRDWSTIECPFNDTVDNAFATSQSAVWDEETLTLTPANGFAKIVMRRLIRQEKYYYYRIYLFYYEQSKPDVLQSFVTNILTNFTSNGVASAVWPNFDFRLTSSSNAESYYVVNTTKHSAFTFYLKYQAVDSSGGLVSTVTNLNLTSPNTTAFNTYARTKANGYVYKTFSEEHPLEGNAVVTANDGTNLTWNCYYTYFKTNEATINKRPADNATTALTATTPIDFEFDSVSINYPNQVSQPQVVFKFINRATNEEVTKSFNENTSYQARLYLFNYLNKIGTDDFSFRYTLPLRVKEAYKGNEAEILATFDINTLAIVEKEAK